MVSSQEGHGRHITPAPLEGCIVRIWFHVMVNEGLVEITCKLVRELLAASVGVAITGSGRIQAARRLPDAKRALAMCKCPFLFIYVWCRRPDLNRHGSPHTAPLKTACLPNSTTTARRLSFFTPSALLGGLRRSGLGRGRLGAGAGAAGLAGGRGGLGRGLALHDRGGRALMPEDGQAQGGDHETRWPPRWSACSGRWPRRRCRIRSGRSRQRPRRWTSLAGLQQNHQDQGDAGQDMDYQGNRGHEVVFLFFRPPG